MATSCLRLFHSNSFQVKTVNFSGKFLRLASVYLMQKKDTVVVYSQCIQSQELSATTLCGQNTTWEEARDACRDMKAHLVTMETVAEWYTVRNLIAEKKGGYYYLPRNPCVFKPHNRVKQSFDPGRTRGKSSWMPSIWHWNHKFRFHCLDLNYNLDLTVPMSPSLVIERSGTVVKHWITRKTSPCVPGCVITDLLPIKCTPSVWNKYFSS